MMQKLVERFLGYVRIHTESDPDSDTTPSSECQWELARALRDELESIGERFVELLFDDEVTAMFRVVIGESITHPQIARLFHAAGPERTIDALARRLSHHAQAGELDVESEREAAVTFLNLLRGEFHMRRLMNLCPRVSGEQRHKHVKACVRQFLRLFGTPGATAQ